MGYLFHISDFAPPDKFEASTIFHVKQKPSTETTDADSSRVFVGTGNHFLSCKSTKVLLGNP